METPIETHFYHFYTFPPLHPHNNYTQQPQKHQNKAMSHTRFDDMMDKFYTQPFYNARVLLAVCMVYMAAGCLVITVSLSLPVIKEQYNIEGTLLFMIAVANQLGFMTGGILTPSYFKLYPRKNIIFLSFLSSIVLSLVLMMGPPLMLIYAIRFVIGACMGVYVSQLPCVITEVSSFDKRGFNFGIGFLVWPLGGILPTFTFKYFNSQEATNIPYVFLGVVGCVIIHYFLPHSPKQLIEIKKFQQSTQAVEFIKSLGGLSASLTSPEFDTIQEFTAIITRKQETQKDQKHGIHILFVPNLIRQTLIVALQYTMFFTVYNYLIFCVPSLLMSYYHGDKASVQNVTYMCLIAEAIAYLVAAKMVQIPWLGKKMSMIYSALAVLAISVLIALNFDLVTCLVVINFFLAIALTAIYPMVAQMYTIEYRLEIISLGVVFNELVPSVMTLVVGSIQEMGVKAPFVYIALALIPTVYYLTQLPDDKMGVSLDETLFQH